MQWQPIETAPKDGTVILVTYPCYNRDNLGRIPDGYTVFTVFWKRISDKAGGWDTGGWILHESPHHWLAIPDPPPVEDSYSKDKKE